MRRRVTCCLPLLLSLVLAPIGVQPALAAGATVFPTGIFPGDLDRVQAALDRGGVVLLKSKDRNGTPTAFNFGPATPGATGTASITRDVVILGERDTSARTTIRGGAVPFVSSARVRLTLVNIAFDGPLEAAVVLKASSGALIAGNEVRGVVGVPFFGVTNAAGMKFIGSSDPAAFSGHIVVSGNVIHELHAAFSDGLVFESVAARVTIAFNLIEQVDTTGIIMYEAGDDVTIVNNVITPGPGSANPFALGNGIQLLGTAGGSYRVEGNRVTCVNPLADGVLMAGGLNWLIFEPGPPIQGAVIHKNDISMSASCCGAITLFDDVSFSTISHNTLRGSAGWGFGLLPTGLVTEPAAVGNTFVANDLAGFTADIAHVFFFSHTRDNVFRGPHGTVIDDGENNVFVD